MGSWELAGAEGLGASEVRTGFLGAGVLRAGFLGTGGYVLGVGYYWGGGWGLGLGLLAVVCGLCELPWK